MWKNRNKGWILNECCCYCHWIFWIFLIGHLKRFHQSDKCALSPSCFVNFVCLWVFEIIKKNPKEFFLVCVYASIFFGSEQYPSVLLICMLNNKKFIRVSLLKKERFCFISLGFISVNFIYAWTLLSFGLFFMCSLCNERKLHFSLFFWWFFF